MSLGFKYPVPQEQNLKSFYTAATKLLKTKESKARIRLMEYRGKVSATMIYDYMPINDVFRRVDENTVLGTNGFEKHAPTFLFCLEPRLAIAKLR